MGLSDPHAHEARSGQKFDYVAGYFRVAEECDRVSEERDRYKAALERYGRHDSGCEAGAPFFPGRCACGYHKALAFFAVTSGEDRWS